MANHRGDPAGAPVRLPGNSNRQTRAVFVLPHFGGGGAERMAIEVATALRARGVDVGLFAIRGSGARVAEVQGSGLPWQAGLSSNIWLPLGAPKLFWRLMRFSRGCDAIVGWVELEPTFVAWLAARLLRKPAAGIVHTDLRAVLSHGHLARARFYARAALPRLDAVAGVSRGTAESAVALGARPGRTQTILNGVDVDRLAELGGGAPLGGGEPTVIGLGRLEFEKGFDLLLAAHARVRAAGLPHRLVIVGEGPPREELRRQARDLGVADSVEFRGFLPNPYPLLRGASVLCFPSRFEGFGLAIAEALALGTPVIAADCPSGPREVLDDARFGDLVPPDDAAALADALAAHLRNPARLQEKARPGPEYVRQRFSIERAADEYAALLCKLTGRR